jgi:6,7-dimethyl-8-ribityllumazine synthase
MNQSTLETTTGAATTTARIGFIQALWHQDIVGQAHAGFVERMAELGLGGVAIESFEVPGSLEIPLQAQRLARSQNYDVIVAAGLIVDGGIYRHDFVASTVLDAMMRVQLDTNVPLLSVVLTPHQFQETDAHAQFFTSHLHLKGREAANACALTLKNAQLTA